MSWLLIFPSVYCIYYFMVEMRPRRVKMFKNQSFRADPWRYSVNLIGVVLCESRKKVLGKKVFEKRSPEKKSLDEKSRGKKVPGKKFLRWNVPWNEGPGENRFPEKLSPEKRGVSVEPVWGSQVGSIDKIRKFFNFPRSIFPSLL